MITTSQLERIKAKYINYVRDRDGYLEMYNSKSFENKEEFSRLIQIANTKIHTVSVILAILGEEI